MDEAGRKGASRELGNQGDNVILNSRGNRRAYILARLDLDGHAELAAKVAAGLPGWWAPPGKPGPKAIEG
jgi:hypothetical protein